MVLQRLSNTVPEAANLSNGHECLNRTESIALGFQKAFTLTTSNVWLVQNGRRICRSSLENGLILSFSTCLTDRVDG